MGWCRRGYEIALFLPVPTDLSFFFSLFKSSFSKFYCQLSLYSIKVFCFVLILGIFSLQASAVFECLDNGEILCAACPNEKIFITGGFSCVCLFNCFGVFFTSKLVKQ